MGKDIICRPGFCIRSELQRFLFKLFYSKRDLLRRLGEYPKIFLDISRGSLYPGSSKETSGTSGHPSVKDLTTNSANFTG